jgi:hypothetical protein
VACVVVLSMAPAQGHCALRDPKKSVFEGFPEADGYRAIVRDVDKNQRSLIEANLPFRVHFNEIGKHTLYVALRGKRPIGIAHARSEESRWGLVEIVWYFDLDMKVRSFRFQRVRSRHGPALEQSAFAEKLVGRDMKALRGLLTPKGALAEAARPVPKRADGLALTVLRSALKTIIVTRSVWERQLQGLGELELAIDLFPEGRTTRRLVSDPKKPSPFAAGRTPRHVDRLRAVGVLDGRGRSLGTAVETRLHVRGSELDLRWSFADDDRLLTVACVQQWPDKATERRFKELEGRVINADQLRDTEVERAVVEVVRLLHGMVQAGQR